MVVPTASLLVPRCGRALLAGRGLTLRDRLPTTLGQQACRSRVQSSPSREFALAADVRLRSSRVASAVHATDGSLLRITRIRVRRSSVPRKPLEEPQRVGIPRRVLHPVYERMQNEKTHSALGGLEGVW